MDTTKKKLNSRDIFWSYNIDYKYFDRNLTECSGSKIILSRDEHKDEENAIRRFFNYIDDQNSKFTYRIYHDVKIINIKTKTIEI